MTDTTLEEITYHELTDRVVNYMIKAFEGTAVSITRLRDLAQKHGKYPGVGYHLRVTDWPKDLNLLHSSYYKDSFSYTGKTYKDLYYRLIQYKADKHPLREHMSPEEVELQLSIRGY